LLSPTLCWRTDRDGATRPNKYLRPLDGADGAYKRPAWLRPQVDELVFGLALTALEENGRRAGTRAVAVQAQIRIAAGLFPAAKFFSDAPSRLGPR
jgi:hypothetical protein